MNYIKLLKYNMDLLNKRQINYVIDKYYRIEHKKLFKPVINEFTTIVNESNIIDDDQDDMDFGGYLVYRINGMPPLVPFRR